MDNDRIELDNNLVEQLDTGKLLNAYLENDKSLDIKDIINRTFQVNQSQSLLETSLENANSSDDMVARLDIDRSSTTTLTTDTSSLAAVASDVSNFPIDQKTVDTLLSGEKWNLGGNKTITYSFYDDDIPNSYYGSERVSEVSNGIKNNVREILENLEPFIDVDFVEVEDSRNSYGQIRYQLTDMGGGYAYAYYPEGFDDTAGDVHLSNKEDINDGGGGFQSGQGSYGYETLIHETLHGLGLKHPGDYNGDGAGDPPFLPEAQDHNTNTVMTYNFVGAGGSTLMPYDIKALQSLYGANENYNRGNTTYSFNEVYAFSDGNQSWGTENRASKLSIWDTGGTDTLDFSKLRFNNSGYHLDLRKGGILTTQNAYNSESYTPTGGSGRFTTSEFGTVIADEVNIENLVNSRSNDFIVANGTANTFSGYGLGASTGDDTIVNSNSKDTLDLSEYKVSDFTTSQNGNNLVIDLKDNGSITVDDYYKVAERDRLNIETNGGNPNPQDGSLVWEKQGLTDERAVATGTKFNLGNGVNATVNWKIITDGGNFVPHGGQDFVSYDSGKTGNHTGYLSLGFNNSNDDPDDLIKLDLDFNKAVTGLSFKLLDVDQSKGKTFDDGVEIYADGVNIKDLSGVNIVTGDNVFADNEPYMNGFEGRGDANSTSENANIAISFGSTEVSSLEIRYFSTDDAIANPENQKIGISDLDFQAPSV